MLLAVPTAVAVAVEPAIFFLADAGRRRALVLAGGLAFAAALATAAVAPSFAVLLVAFTALHPASGAFVSLSQATLMDVAPAERERNLTRWTIAGSAGALAGPAAIGAAVAAGLGWRAVLLALAAGAVVLLAVVAARVRFPGRAAGAAPVRLGDVVEALRRRDVVRWLVLLEAADLLLDVLLGFTALYLVDEVGAGAGAAGAAVAAWTGAGLVGGVCVLRLLRRVSGLRYLRASALAAAALFAGFLLAGGVVPKLLLLVLLGLVNAGWYPVLKARLYAALPERSGLALTLGSAAALPSALVPLALGLIAERWGLENALWLLLLAPALLLALVPRRRG